MPPTSELYEIRDIPDAGRGVIATRLIPADTLVFESGPPACGVIFNEYKKETCALCYHWNRGRALPIRDNDVGKVFCSEECQAIWTSEAGPRGVELWKALSSFVKRKGKAVSYKIWHDRLRPSAEYVHSRWEEAKRQALVIAQSRASTEQAPPPALRRAAAAVVQKTTVVVYPDILSYQVSAYMFRAAHSARWKEEVRDLAMNEQPYQSEQELDAHCNSMVQLAALLPAGMSVKHLYEACSTILKADSHNAFGINSGSSSKEKEEYMGYALFPHASYFNHSCQPNLTKTRDGRTWQFRTTRDVSEGEELCITYLGGAEAELTLEQRRSRLSVTWEFECCCRKCKEDAAAALLEEEN